MSEFLIKCVCGVKCDSERALRSHRRGCTTKDEVVEHRAEQKQPQLIERKKNSGMRLPVNNHSEAARDASDPSYAFTDNDRQDVYDEIEWRERVKIPGANESEEWKSLDEEFESRYSPIANEVKCNPSQAMERFTDCLYDTAVSVLGVVENESSSTAGKKCHKNRPLEKARKMKQDLKKEWKKLMKQGASGDDEDLQSCKRRFFKIMKYHNALRKQNLNAKEKKCASKEQESFKKNPWKFSKELFKKKQKGKPSATKEEAEKYYSERYKDDQYNDIPHKRVDMEKPAEPQKLYNLSIMTEEEHKEYILKRKNSSSPGPNAIPYLVYKKCPYIRRCLYEIHREVWIVGNIPDSWRYGTRILLPKEDGASSLDNFRDINLTNTDCKIFWGIIGQRTMQFLQENKYIDTTLQKGFVSGVSGCIEHTTTVSALLQNAKTHRRSICSTWIDVQKAFGSVNHNLILFTLEWYHIPTHIIKMLHSYYKNLRVAVRCEKWTTSSIPIKKGVFEGDPWALVAFNMVWNLGLDDIKRSTVKGYHHKEAGVYIKATGYADDLNTNTKTGKETQVLMNVLDNFLTWSRLKVKPSKCHIMAMKVDNESKQYTTYDPEVSISGVKITAVSEGEAPIRYLGKHIHAGLSEQHIRVQIKEELNSMMNAIEKCHVTGPMKAWIYNFYVIAAISWKLQIYTLPITYIKELEALVNRHLKKWLKIARCASCTVIYRSKDNFGLHIKKIETVYKSLQVGIAYSLKHNRDPNCAAIFQEKQTRELKMTHWRPSQMLEKVERAVDLDKLTECAKTKPGRGGLGLEKRKARTEKEKVKDKAIEITETDNMTVMYSFAMQGAWTNWDKGMEADTTWNTLLYGLSPSLVSFMINSIQLTLPSPDNLVRWGKTTVGECYQCKARTCTLLHILSDCKVSLDQGRYTWRHDCILELIHKSMEQTVNNFNSRMVKNIPDAPKYIKFVVAGENKKTDKSVPQKILSSSNDWIIMADIGENNLTFPVSIYATPLRPDIVVFSRKSKKVIIVELTCPKEERMSTSHQLKKDKYNKELIPGCQKNGWQAYLFPVEVGCRGFVSNSLDTTMRAIGMVNTAVKDLKKSCSKSALRSSYNIWLQRRKLEFNKW